MLTNVLPVIKKKRINSAVIASTSSASSGNLSSSTNVCTVAKRNECNKNKNKGAILDSNSRKKKAKQFKATEGEIINSSNFPKRLLKTEEHFRVAGPGSSSRRSSCVFCSYLSSLNENVRTKLKWKEFMKQTHWICTICQVKLCKGHFDAFHSEFWNFEKIVPYLTLNTIM